uniref:Uncharacterized protein n=1 Tax=Thermosporothrix sp. COM3 TaxID=2490863 RepID=A0A455SLJ8_9CHLR|nr:hypothetical protein KTC_25430 [Thermosporothrix sp. COM3]
MRAEKEAGLSKHVESGMRTAALQQAVQQRVRAVSVRDRPDGVIYEKA